MGHTLVAEASPHSMQTLQNILLSVDADQFSKIPYGRECDRSQADACLPYHITICHWAKGDDARYLPLLEKLTFTPCEVIVTGSSVMYAEEGSLLLYFSILPGPGYAEMTSHTESALHIPTSHFPHMTLAVSMDHSAVHQLKERLDAQLQYPFPLHIGKLALYHIWRPVKLVRTFCT